MLLIRDKSVYLVYLFILGVRLSALVVHSNRFCSSSDFVHSAYTFYHTALFHTRSIVIPSCYSFPHSHRHFLLFIQQPMFCRTSLVQLTWFFCPVFFFNHDYLFIRLFCSLYRILSTLFVHSLYVIVCSTYSLVHISLSYFITHSRVVFL